MNLSRFLHLRLQGVSVDAPVFNGGDPPPQQSTTSTVQNYSPEEAARRTKVFDAADAIYQKNKDAYSSILNPASVPVGPSAATTQGQQMVTAAATGAGQGVANNAANATNFGTSGAVLDPNQNPGLQGVLNTATRRLTDSFNDAGGVMSNIRSGFMDNAPSGDSTREGIAQGIAAKGFQNSLSDAYSSILNNAYNQGLDYMGKTTALAPSTYNLLMQPGVSVSGVGSQQEAYQQAQNDYNASGVNWSLNKDWAALSPYASIVTGMSNPTTTTTATAPGQRSGLQQLVGGAASGGALAAMMGINPFIGASAMLTMGLMNK